MESHTIIFGKDLSKFVNKHNYPNLMGKIDPNGVNVVYFTMTHNDTHIRASLLVKILNDRYPYEAVMDFPFNIWKKITHSINADDLSAPFN